MLAFMTLWLKEFCVNQGVVPGFSWHSPCILNKQGKVVMKAKTFILNMVVEILIVFGICAGFLLEVCVDSTRGILRRVRAEIVFLGMELTTPSKE